MNRRDYLLLLLGLAADEEGVVKSRVKVTKLAFLAQKEKPNAVKSIVKTDQPYEFIPYLHGPFSKDLLNDLEELANEGLIKISNEFFGINFERKVYTITRKGYERFRKLKESLDPEALKELTVLISKYAEWPLEKILKHVYRNYPEDSTPKYESLVHYF
jgi:uncharacterized protein YwgA